MRALADDGERRDRLHAADEVLGMDDVPTRADVRDQHRRAGRADRLADPVLAGGVRAALDPGEPVADRALLGPGSVEDVDDRAARAERLREVVERTGQHLVDFERPVQRSARLVQQREPLRERLGFPLARPGLLEEPGVLQRDRRVVGERLDQLHRVRAEVLRDEKVRHQHTVDVVAARDRDAEDRTHGGGTDQPPRRRREPEGRVRLHVACPHDAPLLEGSARHAFSQTQELVAGELGLQVEPPLVGEATPCPVVAEDRRGVAAEELDRLGRDPVEHLVGLEARRELACQPVEARRLSLARLRLRIQPALFERHRQVLAEHAERLDARRRDRPAARLVVGARRAEDAVADHERCDDEAPAAEVRMRAERRRDRRGARQVLVRKHGDRAPALHRLPERAGVRREGQADLPLWGLRTERTHRLEPRAVRREEQDAHPVESDHVVGRPDERVEPRIPVPRRLHGHRGPVEALEPLLPFLRVAEQPSLLDRHRRLVGETREQRDLVGVEAAHPFRIDVERAGHSAPAPEWHADEAAEAELERPPLVERIVPGVRGQILDHHGLARRDDPARQALADLDPRARHHAGGRLGPGRDQQVVALAEPDAGRLGAQQARRLVHDQPEHLVGLVDGGEPARHLVEHLELAPVPLGVLEQPRVFQEEPDLVAHALRELELASRRRATRLPPHEVEGPGRRRVEDDREEEPRLVGERTEQRVREAGIVRHVVGEDGPTLPPDRKVKALLAQRKRRDRERLHVFLGHVVRRRWDEVVRGAVVQVGRGRLRTEQARELAADAPEPFAHVQRRADRGRDRGQRLALRDAPAQVPLEGRVLPEQVTALDHPADDRGEAVQVDGLHDVARGAPLDRLDRRVQRGVARDDHDLGRQLAPSSRVHDGEAVAVGKHEVEQDQRDGPLVDEPDALGRRVRHEHPVPLAFEMLGEETGDPGIVIDDEDLLRGVHGLAYRGVRSRTKKRVRTPWAGRRCGRARSRARGSGRRRTRRGLCPARHAPRRGTATRRPPARAARTASCPRP